MYKNYKFVIILNQDFLFHHQNNIYQRLDPEFLWKEIYRGLATI